MTELTEEQKARQKEAIDQAKARIAKKAVAFKRCLRDHPDGKLVIMYLKQEFLASELFNPDPHVTAGNAKARDIIDYIERMIRFEEEPTHVAETITLPER